MGSFPPLTGGAGRGALPVYGKRRRLFADGESAEPDHRRQARPDVQIRNRAIAQRSFSKGPRRYRHLRCSSRPQGYRSLFVHPRSTRSGFGSRLGEPAASACGRRSETSRLICAAGSDTSGTVKRLRCCRTLKRGYAADFARWCGSVDEYAFASFANGESVRISRRKPPGALMALGDSRTRPLSTLPYPMPTLRSSSFRPWSVLV